MLEQGVSPSRPEARSCGLRRPTGSACFLVAALLFAGCSGGSPEVVGSQGGSTGSQPSAAQAAGAANRGSAQAGTGATGVGQAGRAASGALAGSAPASSAGASASGRSGNSAGVPAAIGGTGGAAAGSGTGAVGSGSAGTAGSTGSGAAALRDEQGVIPHASWNCGMPEGIPALQAAEAVFDGTFEVAEVHDIGETQYGHRLQIDIKGGSAQGAKLQGKFLDRGLDYHVTLENGAVEDEQINILQTSDGANIYMRSCGTAPGPNGEVRMVFDFEAPNAGSYNWLNTGKFVGSRAFDAAAKTLSVRVLKAGTFDARNAVTVMEPSGVPDQTWDCKKAAGTKGAVVYTESVGIGAGSISVGASKRGTRNIIPISGGTTSGKVPGTVLSGGADFQIIENGAFRDLDARYTVEAREGDLIIVRNCGPVGALVPVFEANKDGKYAWLNANTWLSSDPGLGLGVVNLTIYEGGK